MKLILNNQRIIAVIVLAIMCGVFNFVILPADSHAQVNLQGTLSNAGTGIYGAGAAVPKLPEQIGRYIKVFLGILGVVLIIIIIYAGFQYMTAGGNEDQVKKARAWIVNAVIGLVIILLAYAITDFVVTKLVGINNPANENGSLN